MVQQNGEGRAAAVWFVGFDSVGLKIDGERLATEETRPKL
jgi:hypothetical protein